MLYIYYFGGVTSSTRVKGLEGDLQTAAKTLGDTLQKLAEVQAVPPSERYETLNTAYEKLKSETLTSFDSGFHTAAAQFEVLHPRLDLSGIDIDNIVVGGQLVEIPDEVDEAQEGLELHAGVLFGSLSAPRGDVVVDQVEIPLVAGGAIADETAEARALNSEAVCQTIVIDSLDP